MKNFIPTKAMVDAGSSLVMAMAFEQTIRPIVEAYESAILKEGQWKIRPDFADMMGERVITNRNQAYLMAEEDWQKFWTRCKEERDKAKLKVEHSETCPLLAAETMVRDCEAVLIDSLAPITKMTNADSLLLGLDKRRQYIDLSMRLIVPFIKNPLLVHGGQYGA